MPITDNNGRTLLIRMCLIVVTTSSAPQQDVYAGYLYSAEQRYQYRIEFFAGEDRVINSWGHNTRHATPGAAQDV